MKILTKKITGLVAALMVVLSSAMTMQVQAAGSATLSLSPSSGSYEKGSTLTVAVYADSSENYNAVQANLTYDSSKLQFASISSSGTAFPFEVESTGGSGSVRMARGVIGGVTGSKKVASVDFTVLGESGSTSITFASSSAITRSSDSSDVWNGSPTGGTYTLKPVPSQSTPTTNPTSQSTSTKPTNTNTTVVQTATADTPAETPVQTTTDQTRTGYPVAITVLDKNKKIVEGASVTLNNETATSDSTGVASFSSVPKGSYTVSVSKDGMQSFDQAVTVVDGEFTKTQEFSVQPAGAKSSNRKYVVAGIVVGVVLLLVGGIMLMNFLSNRRELNRHVAPSAATHANDVSSQLSNIKTEVPEPSQVISPNQHSGSDQEPK